MPIPDPQPPFNAVNHELLYLISQHLGTGHNGRTRFFRYLADGGGSADANGDYSSGAQQFSAAPQGETWHVHRLGVVGHLDLPPGSGVSMLEYAPGGTLSNPWELVHDDGSTTTALNPWPVDSLARLSHNGMDLEIIQSAEMPHQVVFRGTLDFTKLSGSPWQLNDGESFRVSLNDDYSALAAHRFYLTGWIE